MYLVKYWKDRKDGTYSRNANTLLSVQCGHNIRFRPITWAPVILQVFSVGIKRLAVDWQSYKLYNNGRGLGQSRKYLIPPPAPFSAESCRSSRSPGGWPVLLLYPLVYYSLSFAIRLLCLSFRVARAIKMITYITASCQLTTECYFSAYAGMPSTPNLIAPILANLRILFILSKHMLENNTVWKWFITSKNTGKRAVRYFGNLNLVAIICSLLYRNSMIIDR